MTAGARAQLVRAEVALAGGELDEAARAFRAYFADRLGRRETARGVDARVASLAATCAFLRGDSAELDGVRELLARASDRDTEWAEYWVGQLRAAIAGEIELVLERAHRAPPGLGEAAPVVVLVAVERAIDRISPADVARARAILAQRPMPPEVHARFAVVAAAAALRAGDRPSAVGELRSLGGAELALHRCLAALADDAHEAAAPLMRALSHDEQRAALAFAAALAAGAEASVAVRALAVLGPLAVTPALVAAAARASQGWADCRRAPADRRGARARGGSDASRAARVGAGVRGADRGGRARGARRARCAWCARPGGARPPTLPRDARRTARSAPLRAGRGR